MLWTLKTLLKTLLEVLDEVLERSLELLLDRTWLVREPDRLWLRWMSVIIERSLILVEISRDRRPLWRSQKWLLLLLCLRDRKSRRLVELLMPENVLLLSELTLLLMLHRNRDWLLRSQ